MVEDMPSGKKVLIVDDEQVNRFYLSALFSRFDWTVEEAENGRIAVQRIMTNRPDIILMDISMPEMDGMEATTLIKKKMPEVPVFGITAHAFPEDRKRFLAAGMDEVFIKPFDDMKLIRAMRIYLTK
jgi:CheY-like chemotaxis protein